MLGFCRIVLCIKILFLGRAWRFGNGLRGPGFIKFIFKSIKDLVFDFLPHLVVDGMRNVLIAAVFPFSRRHGHKVPLRTIDHL